MPWASLVSATRATAHRLLGGVSVTAGAVSGTGLLDQNSELVMDGQVVSVDYALTGATALFGSLQYNDTVSIGGSSYRVQHEPMRIGDGSDCVIPLEFLGVANLLLQDGGDFLLEDGGLLLLEFLATAVANLFLEDGGNFLLEDGGLLLLES